MSDPPEDFDPLPVAMTWVARITTVALEMVLPGLAGSWLDRRFGTSYLVVVGFVFGFVAGLWHLLQLTQSSRPPRHSGQAPEERDR